ncbi:MAG: hypothetical protein FJX59_18765, partial [Alphaproteobacteria bacterium]|nr:hypothetical protein [Alphaproteobacteria bacterium]
MPDIGRPTIASIDTWKQRGGAAAANGQYAEAARCSREILKLDPLDWGGTKSLLLMARLSGELDDPMIEVAFKAFFKDFFSRHPALGITLSPTLTFDRWIAGAGLKTVEIDSAQIVGTTPPYTAEPTLAVEIPDAGFVPGWDHVIAPTGEVLDGSGYLDLRSALNVMPHVCFPEANRVMHIGAGEPTRIPGRILFLSAPTLFNVGHWLVDFLPRLRGIGADDKDARIAVPAPLPNRYREFLATF